VARLQVHPAFTFRQVVWCLSVRPTAGRLAVRGVTETGRSAGRTKVPPARDSVLAQSEGGESTWIRTIADGMFRDAL